MNVTEVYMQCDPYHVDILRHKKVSFFRDAHIYSGTELCIYNMYIPAIMIQYFSIYLLLTALSVVTKWDTIT